MNKIVQSNVRTLGDVKLCSAQSVLSHYKHIHLLRQNLEEVEKVRYRVVGRPLTYPHNYTHYPAHTHLGHAIILQPLYCICFC